MNSEIENTRIKALDTEENQTSLHKNACAEKLKKCSKCEKFKPLSDFFRNKTRKDGHDYECKSCKKNRTKEWLKKKS